MWRRKVCTIYYKVKIIKKSVSKFFFDLHDINKLTMSENNAQQIVVHFLLAKLHNASFKVSFYDNESNNKMNLIKETHHINQLV